MFATNAISEVPHYGSTLPSCRRVQSMIAQSSRHHHIHTFPPASHFGVHLTGIPRFVTQANVGCCRSGIVANHRRWPHRPEWPLWRRYALLVSRVHDLALQTRLTRIVGISNLTGECDRPAEPPN